MNPWKDIYEAAGRRLSDLLIRTSEEDQQDSSPEEFMIFRKNLQAQKAYDAEAAFRKLQLHKRRVVLRRWSVAAGVLLLISLACWVLYDQRPQGKEMPLVQHQPTILPGEKKAVLTLANGSVMNLRDSSLALADLEACLKADTAQLQEQVAWHTLSIPRGGEFYMTLPDSTQVWLNAESELRFPTKFTGDVREVKLKGEAYFDVTHQKEKSFVVTLSDGIVIVYGTQFCISDYENSALTATLVQGSIGFESLSGKKVKIQPAQQLTYDVATDEIAVREVDTRVYTSWKDQLFCFENQNLGEIMQILSRWYDLEITFETEELKQIRFSGTLDRYSDVAPFLRLFEAGAGIKFDIQQKNVKIRIAD